MKFIFETGAIIEVNDENIIKLIKKDSRYKEHKPEASKKATKKEVDK